MEVNPAGSLLQERQTFEIVHHDTRERVEPLAPVTLPTVPDIEAKRVIKVVATAYSSSYDETDSDPFTTASGERVRDGVIAANWLPFGARVRIPDHYGDKVFVVKDRMHPRNHDLVDIWMSSKAQAIEWGVKHVRIEII